MEIALHHIPDYFKNIKTELQQNGIWPYGWSHFALESVVNSSHHMLSYHLACVSLEQVQRNWVCEACGTLRGERKRRENCTAMTWHHIPNIDMCLITLAGWFSLKKIGTLGATFVHLRYAMLKKKGLPFFNFPIFSNVIWIKTYQNRIRTRNWAQK